jgi:DNA polymerase-3 subunit delta
MKPAYLIAGDDEAKIARTRGRLRDRAEREGGPGALEVFEAGDGRRSPDVEAVLASLAAISLIASRRYLLVDGVESWGKGDAEKAVQALGQVPPETTVALIAHGKPPGGVAKAVEKAGGEVLSFALPRERDLPKQLVADARELGFELDPAAARLLVGRLGPRPMRLRSELERLALWAGEGGSVGVDDLEAMISDTSEEAIWTLADAVIAGDEAETMRVAERLVSQGEALPRIVYALAPRLRQGLKAATELEAGRPSSEVAKGLRCIRTPPRCSSRTSRAAPRRISTPRSAPWPTSSSGHEAARLSRARGLHDHTAQGIGLGPTTPSRLRLSARAVPPGACPGAVQTRGADGRRSR